MYIVPPLMYFFPPSHTIPSLFRLPSSDHALLPIRRGKEVHPHVHLRVRAGDPCIGKGAEEHSRRHAQLVLGQMQPEANAPAGAEGHVGVAHLGRGVVPAVGVEPEQDVGVNLCISYGGNFAAKF